MTLADRIARLDPREQRILNAALIVVAVLFDLGVIGHGGASRRRRKARQE